MANRDVASGLTPIGTLTGADWRGKLRQVQFVASGDAVACFIGDRVKLTGTSDATGRYPIVAQAAITDAAIGVLVGLQPDGTDEGSLTSIHRKASTTRIAFVCMGGDVLYSVQEDSVGNSITLDEVGLNAEIIVGTGSAVTGISASEIDSTSAATSSALGVRIHHIIDSPDNVLGNFCKWAVTLNDYQGDRQQTGI